MATVVFWGGGHVQTIASVMCVGVVDMFRLWLKCVGVGVGWGHVQTIVTMMCWGGGHV